MVDTGFVAAVVVFVFRGERLLALRRAVDNESAPGAWEGISGRIGPGEQPIAAAVRETLEESGLTVRVAPRPVYSYVAKRNRDDMIVVAYRADPIRGEVMLSPEHDAFRWMTLDEFGEACPFAQLVEAAGAAAEEKSRPPD